MGQHRRFPGSFLLIAAVLAIPSLLYSFVHAANAADECAALKASAKDGQYVVTSQGLKCE